MTNRTQTGQTTSNQPASSTPYFVDSVDIGDRMATVCIHRSLLPTIIRLFTRCERPVDGNISNAYLAIRALGHALKGPTSCLFGNVSPESIDVPVYDGDRLVAFNDPFTDVDGMDSEASNPGFDQEIVAAGVSNG